MPLPAGFPPRGSKEKQGVDKVGIGSLRCLMAVREASDVMAFFEVLPRGPGAMYAFLLVSLKWEKIHTCLLFFFKYNDFIREPQSKSTGMW